MKRLSLLVRFLALAVLLVGQPVWAAVPGGSSHACCADGSASGSMTSWSGADSTGAGPAPGCEVNHCTVCVTLHFPSTTGADFRPAGSDVLRPEPAGSAGRAHDAPTPPPPQHA